MNEGLEMDPNPSSFLPLIFVLHNSTNLSSTICFTIRLSKLLPTSDNRTMQTLHAYVFRPLVFVYVYRLAPWPHLWYIIILHIIVQDYFMTIYIDQI